jgi:hypothetical protein
MVSLEKVAEKAPELLSLSKNAAGVLSRKNLSGLTSRVAVVFDFSGSMRHEYSSGSIQKLAEKALAFATQIDDDGEIDVFIFHSGAEYLGAVTLDNFRGVIAKWTAGKRMGTTNYTDAFKAVVKHYGFVDAAQPATGKLGGLFGKKVAPAASTAGPVVPVFALFLTDGAPDNRTSAVKALTDASVHPIFWQFLSIGSESIPFLEKLDDLDGRYVDNADYKPVGDVNVLTSTELYEMLVDEYPGWLTVMRERGHIV